MSKQISHLQMIQSVITRLADNSFKLKSWSVVLVSALFAMSAKDVDTNIVIVAFFPALVFWGLDAYFLWQERLFRALYETVAKDGSAAQAFSMSTKKMAETEPSWANALVSKTVLFFHGTVVLMVVGTAVLLRYC